MSNIEDDFTVFKLACEMEDISRSERAALKRVARRLERQWNARTITNAKHLVHGPIDCVALIPQATD